MLNLNDKSILVTGGAGFLGKQVVEQLCQAGATLDKITIPRSRDCDLRNLNNCKKAVEQQDIVIHLAAHVGGIGLNREKPAELFYDNLMMGLVSLSVLEQFVLIPNSLLFLLRKTISGMATLKKPTPLMALRKRLF